MQTFRETGTRCIGSSKAGTTGTSVWSLYCMTLTIVQTFDEITASSTSIVVHRAILVMVRDNRTLAVRVAFSIRRAKERRRTMPKLITPKMTSNAIRFSGFILKNGRSQTRLSPIPFVCPQTLPKTLEMSSKLPIYLIFRVVPNNCLLPLFPVCPAGYALVHRSRVPKSPNRNILSTGPEYLKENSTGEGPYFCICI